MNRHLLIGATILACLCIFISIAYACVQIDVYIGNYHRYVGVSDGSKTVTVTANVVYGGPAIVSSWSWDAPSVLECDGIERNEYDSTATYWSDTTGRYTVWAYAENATHSYDDDWAYVYVVEVDLSSSSSFVALYEDEEDDLVQVGISLLPSQLWNGTVNLTASGGISVWYNSGGTNQVSLPANWSVARKQVPSSVWVKGTSVSSSLNDASLNISYVNGGTIDTDTALFTVIDVDITQPTGTGSDYQFSFNSASPGVCEFQVTGTTGIAALNADLKWTLEEIDDPYTTLTAVPDPCVGPSITFKYTGLPSSNSEFGKKKLTLEYSNTGIKDTMDLEIFFEPTATNNPGEYDGKSKEYPYPNWFYYWAKNRGFYYGAGTKSICGEYEPSDNTLWLFESAYTETEEPDDYVVDLYNHRYRTNINTSVNGIANTLENSISTDDTKILYFMDTLHNHKIYSNPNSVAITAGTNGVIDSQPWGNCGHNPTHDDAVVDSAEGQVLHTGYDGILEILGGKQNDDEWKIYEYMGQQKNINNGYGQPWYISITHGDDDWLQTNPEPEHGWDVIDLTGVDPVTFIRPKEWIGIDFVNVVCNHELKHQDLYDDVRINPEGPLPYEYDEPGDDDADDDCVHDIDVEGKSPYYLSPYEEDTYNMEIDFYNGSTLHGPCDNEFLCYMGQDDPPVDPSTDWSVRGKQWH